MLLLVKKRNKNKHGKKNTWNDDVFFSLKHTEQPFTATKFSSHLVFFYYLRCFLLFVFFFWPTWILLLIVGLVKYIYFILQTNSFLFFCENNISFLDLCFLFLYNKTDFLIFVLLSVLIIIIFLAINIYHMYIVEFDFLSSSCFSLFKLIKFCN